MTDITKVGGTHQAFDINRISEDAARVVSQNAPTLPGATKLGMDLSAADTPRLAAPESMSDARIKTLTDEALLFLINSEERKTAVKTGIASLKATAAETKRKGEEKIEQIKKQIEAAEKARKASVFKKIFGWIGAIVSAVVGVASFAAGCVTGNPLLIAGGGLLMFSAASQITERATGKGIFAHMLSGVDQKTAQWVAMALELVVAIAGAVCAGLGMAGIGDKAAKAADAAEKVAKAIEAGQKARDMGTMVGHVSNVAGGAAKIGDGATGIAIAAYQYQGTTAVARQKELSAVLAKLRMVQDLDTESLQRIMEKFNQQTEQVGDILKGMNDTKAKIMTQGAAPAAGMA